MRVFERVTVLRRESELGPHVEVAKASIRWAGPVLLDENAIVAAPDAGQAMMLVQGYDCRPGDVLRTREHSWVVLMARDARSAWSPRFRGWQVTAELWRGG